ncbi:hypothetical protein BCR44DRAFT_1431240 [Catenaria anguillulae PL171]|uniref:Uncharacterized protein n=1 Tax=Catenaria anguillulae PL171 TaxID=765915 RepID=A0A1Y2HQW5_9FUNG|nr:hypothetical protein BCR44DRAFT_1431240 [Catenaria anguillulae PL171]
MPNLHVLNLDNNALMGPMPGGHAAVVELSVLDNMIELFDARMWPAVKRVELGGNKVTRVELEAVDQVEYVGLARQAHMDARLVRGGGGGHGGRTRAASGSMGTGRPRRTSAVADEELDEETLRLLAPERANHEDEPHLLDFTDLQPVSRLNLSGNVLPSLDRFVHMYQLVHLNLAGCGLRSLPARFARHVPALRVLDLAQNCLQDISPLCKLTRLRWLSLRGNDVADFFHAVGYLAHLTRLEWLDLRQNPLTGLFYPNLVSAGAANGTGGSTSRQETTTNDEEWAGIDAEYQRSLNDSTVVKRACYRTSLLFHLRASLQVLDRLHISEQERINVPAKYARMEKSLAGIMTGSAGGGGSMRNVGGASLSTKTSATNTPASRMIGVGGGSVTPSGGGTQRQVPQPPRALTPIDRRATESPRSHPPPLASPLAPTMVHQQHHTLPVPSLGSNYAPSGPIDEASKLAPASSSPVRTDNDNGGGFKSPNPPAPSGGSSNSMQASWVQQYGDLTSETEILREIHQLTASERGRKLSSSSPGRYRLEQEGGSVASPTSTVIRPLAHRH